MKRRYQHSSRILPPLRWQPGVIPAINRPHYLYHPQYFAVLTSFFWYLFVVSHEALKGIVLNVLTYYGCQKRQTHCYRHLEFVSYRGYSVIWLVSRLSIGLFPVRQSALWHCRVIFLFPDLC